MKVITKGVIIIEKTKHPMKKSFSILIFTAERDKEQPVKKTERKKHQ